MAPNKESSVSDTSRTILAHPNDISESPLEDPVSSFQLATLMDSTSSSSSSRRQPPIDSHLPNAPIPSSTPSSTLRMVHSRGSPSVEPSQVRLSSAQFNNNMPQNSLLNVIMFGVGNSSVVNMLQCSDTPVGSKGNAFESIDYEWRFRAHALTFSIPPFSTRGSKE